ncbi:MAG: AAA family ATPase [Thermoanaerobaculia bacterium]|nr:AAA family ATPase [Thermoanaerobaculia bacterium]
MKPVQVASDPRDDAASLLEQFKVLVKDANRLEQLRGSAPDPNAAAGSLLEGLLEFPDDIGTIRSLVRPDELPERLRPLLVAIFSQFDQGLTVTRKAVSAELARRGVVADRTESYEISPPEDWPKLVREIREANRKASTLDFALNLAKEAANGVRAADLDRFVREHLQSMEAQGADSLPAKFRAASVEEFLQRDFPAKEELLSPWLHRGGTALIFARRGIGKTWFVQTLSCSLASARPVFRQHPNRPAPALWHAKRPVTVFHLDGEMTGRDLKERFAHLIAANGFNTAGRLKVLASDTFDDPPFPSLSRVEGRATVEALAADSEVLILDNISTLFPGLDENDAQSWDPIQDWLLRLRRAGKTVILVHHANKSGGQRGTSKREDVNTITIELEEPNDFIPEEGARFGVIFKKNRGLMGEIVRPFEVRLHPETYLWEASTPKDDIDEEILKLDRKGLSTHEIAAKIKLHQSNVSRRLKRLQTSPNPEGTK